MKKSKTKATATLKGVGKVTFEGAPDFVSEALNSVMPVVFNRSVAMYAEKKGVSLDESRRVHADLASRELERIERKLARPARSPRRSRVKV